jgi:phosphatidylglycerophosphate synthase
MKWIPYSLIYSRIVLGILVVLLAIFQPNHFENWIISSMILAIFTDIFDGIIARKIGLSTEKIRTHDSNVDLFFWLLSIVAIFSLRWVFVAEHLGLISIVFFLEISTYIFSFFKFKRTIATHSILAKIWTLSLLVFLIDLTIGQPHFLTFWICIVLGIISRLEIIAIILILKNWSTDVPSLRGAFKINKGIKVKKSKLFNS